jgi:NAD(P)-dependent dehydrogenase (short-subunit alcohol dehydrogenase family)
MRTLAGKVAIVAGASRGAGRGIALVLGEAGATVYVAARSSRSGSKPLDGAPGTVEDTADEVSARGGKGLPVAVDLSNESETAELFQRVFRECGRLDIVANSAWGPQVMAEWSKPFWELTPELFRETLGSIGACWWTSVYAARLMGAQKHGLIVHVTDNDHEHPAGYRGQALHDIGHECIDRLVHAMSLDTKENGVAVVGLNPGFMRTERVLKHMSSDELKKQFRFDLSESPEYIGRAVAALAADPHVFRKNGQLLWVGDLADEYGFTDIDGRRIPRFDPHAPQREYPV